MSDWKARLVETAPDTGIATAVLEAISILLVRDANLFERDVNERTISGVLARYLGAQFPDWDVDPEYNRHGMRAKVSGSRRVLPDVIVHHRGIPDNLLVIEIKKGNDDGVDAADIRKLEAFRREPLNYRHALYLRFSIPPEPIGMAYVRWV